MRHETTDVSDTASLLLAEGRQTLKLSEPSHSILLVTLNRPHTANAFNAAMARELHEIFAATALLKQRFRCVVLTGEGGRAFCAGGDFKERGSMSPAQWTAQHELVEAAVASVRDCPLPVVAAVNGAAIGGGLELVLHCDFAYAAPHARFALPETSLGIIPGTGGTQTLPRAVGGRRASELIFSAAVFGADEALAWGVVNRVVAAASLLDETLATASRIASNAPVAVQQAKQAIRHGSHQSLETGMAFEVQAYYRTVVSEDRLEGLAAYREKRRPSFSGR